MAAIATAEVATARVGVAAGEAAAVGAAPAAVPAPAAAVPTVRERSHGEEEGDCERGEERQSL